ncbi:MAG TPA: DNA replication/repair protein RecF [Bacillota bacterium]|nr:DNA replication/repair protein RecF [Bacillota bacterium]
MKLESIALYNFRNYAKQEIKLGEGVNFFIGENGSGKTNILEAIYFLALTKSYKTNETNLIKYENEFARVHAKAKKNNRTSHLKMIISANGKKVSLNSSEVKKLSDYIGFINVLSFLPEDMMVIKGSPKDRRYFIDLMYGQIDKDYLNELSNYKIVLKQRNELLKRISETDKPDMILLDVLTEQLSESAIKIVEFRKRFVQAINNSLKSMYRFLTDKNNHFAFEYIPSVDKDIEQLLKSKYRTDILLKTTNIGPHRDDYHFILDDLSAKDNASQGEQRIMMLALILAIGDIIYNKKKERPIFLLDDVFSELDTKRQNKLIKYLLELDAQTIITTTNLAKIDASILNNSKIFRVQNNTVREEH